MKENRQLVIVHTPDWNSFQGSMQLFEENSLIKEFPVVIGQKGFAWGAGLHPMTPTKIEGDLKSPAGIFTLGTAFGTSEFTIKYPYLRIHNHLEAVDDSNSKFYNQIVDSRRVVPDWQSSEKMGEIDLYQYGLVVNHNYPNPKPGLGSAIFIHLWRGPNSGTAGCTAMDLDQLKFLLEWLDPQKKPILIQAPLTRDCDLECLRFGFK